MGRVKVYADFYEIRDAVIEIDTDKEIELVYEDEFINFQKPIPEDTIRIFATIEPDGRFIDFINNHQDCFNYLLTAEPDLLHLPQAIFMPGYPAWVPPNDSTNKTFGVSSVFSARNCFPGHALRHELWRRQEEIKIPRFFYVGSRMPLEGVDMSKVLTLPPDHFGKKVVMDYMFHIVIDCFKKDNLFTEKLIDPLISMVYPIYWGAKNISKFFDVDSIIRVNSVDEIIEVCNNLTPHIYYGKLNTIDWNYKTALEYSDYAEVVKRAINKALKKEL
jgi:hypothetical protein